MGNCLSALQLAGDLLKTNMHGSCALELLLLSDSKPSDPLPRTQTWNVDEYYGDVHLKNRQKYVSMFCAEIDQFASRLGRRLSVHTIDFAWADEDFTIETDGQRAMFCPHVEKRGAH